MFRSVLFKGFAALCSLIFLASPALAAPDLVRPVGGADASGLRLDRARVLVDVACTDSFNVPATTVNVDVRTIANWDTMAEAINPDKNIGNAAQTSGSADGWCDSTPWIMKGALTGAGSVFFGPLKNIPNAGFMLGWNFTAAAGNYAFWFCHQTPHDTSLCDDDGGMAGIATTGALITDIVPIFSNSASQYSAFDNFWFVSGRRAYMRLVLSAAGAYTFSVDTVPVLPYYYHRGD